MGIAMPEYDWELDEGLGERIRMFRQILAAMKDSRLEPCVDGAAYMNQFYNENSLPHPADPEDWYIDIAPLEDNLLHDSLGFISMAETRAAKIVDFLENMNVVFAEEKWRKQVDGEIKLRGLELGQIAADARRVMAFYGPESLSRDDSITHLEFMGRMVDVRDRYEALMQSRSCGEGQVSTLSLNHAFHYAGRQTALSVETLRYATSASVVVEDAMQVLLGITVMSPAHRSVLVARTEELQDIAVEMMLVVEEALKDGRRLTRDSYAAREYNRPVFRSVSDINRQYLGSGPQ